MGAHRGHGDAKINAAFSWGGPELAISTVQNLTGVKIDHFAIVDFASFEKLTDELGGVTIATTAGDRHMNGDGGARVCAQPPLAASRRL